MWAEEEAVRKELGVFGGTRAVDRSEELGQKGGRLMRLLVWKSHSEGCE